MYSVNASIVARQPVSLKRRSTKACAEPQHGPSGYAVGYGSPRPAASSVTLEEGVQWTQYHSPAGSSGSRNFKLSAGPQYAAYTETLAEETLTSTSSSEEINTALLCQLAAFSRELLDSAPWEPEAVDTHHDVPLYLLPPAEMPTCPVNLMQNLANATRRMLSYEPMSSLN